MLQQDRLDVIFQALGDPSRLSMVETLARAPASLGVLAGSFDMSLSAVGQHMKVLERAGVVQTAKVGRARICTLVPDVIGQLETWAAERRAIIERRLDRLEAYLAGDQND